MKSREYEQFIDSKRVVIPECGFEPLPIAAPLFPFQRANVEWAVRRGRCALFLDTGLGKTIQQLEVARQIAAHTGGYVLILAPLAVAHQTAREGARFGYQVTYAREQSEVSGPIVITNYERLKNFDTTKPTGVVLDESGILKSFSGSTKQALVEAFAQTPYRLCCSATPAPNDHLELGNHAEFLGVMSSHQMIARWFINDTSTFGTYRLKGHAIESFWDWVSSWAAMASLPSDIGNYANDGYILPQMRTIMHEVDVDVTDRGDALTLIRMPELNATSVHKEQRRTADVRARAVADLVNAEPSEPWIIWCYTDYEADALKAAIPSAVDVRGSDSAEKKEAALIAFTDGKIQILISKPKLAGFGLNWQHVARVAFVGATFSFESFYQAIRRTWRFGQTREVGVHVVMGSTERAVWDVLQRKTTEFESMKREMLKAARRSRQTEAASGDYQPRVTMKLPTWLTGAIQ
jgi:superfamily II DNA or RNA helicase